MIYLVTGGRDYRDKHVLNAFLDEFHGQNEMRFLIHGKARGADTLAHKWALNRGVQPIAFEALWDFEGDAAGSRRNARMIEVIRPKACIAFPGGRGTSNMIRLAYDAGIEIIDVEDYL